MPTQLKKAFPYWIAPILGGVLPLAFAPYHLWPLAIVCPAGLLFLWRKATPKKAFILGLEFGLALFGMGVSWVFVSIHYFGNTDIPLSLFITFLFILSLSFFVAAQGYVLTRYFKGNPFCFAFLGFPSSWVLFEWLRSFLFGGFPWLFLGYTQLNTPLRGFAPIVSVYGVSFLTLILSAALVFLVFEPKKNLKIMAFSVFSLLFGVGYLINSYSFIKLSDKAYSVSLVQGNVSPTDKFALENPLKAIEQTYEKLTRSVWNSDLIIWPENAISYPLPHSETYLQKLKERAIANQTTLITGIQTLVNSKDYFNSLIAIGIGEGMYHKRVLVPFGEFLPFDSLLRGMIHFFDIPMSNFVKGPSHQALLKIKELNIAPLICYEIAFPELVRESLQNAHVIVLLSEDGWFGNSWGPHQHLEIAKMRALETGRYVLRSTTSGISAIINPNGELESRGPQFQEYVLQGNFFATTGQTPWMILGLWPFLIFLMACFCLPGRLAHFKLVRAHDPN